MAAIYLRHPVHGEKVACGEHEASMDRANGWIDFDPSIRAVEPIVEVPAFLTPVVKEPKPKSLKDLAKG